MDQREDSPPVVRSGGDPIEALVEMIRSGSMTHAFELMKVDAVNFPDGDLPPHLVGLGWAEVGRNETVFYMRRHPSMAGADRITVRNEYLWYFSRLAELTYMHEAGRVPPPIIDAEALIKQMIERTLEVPNDWPDDVKEMMRALSVRLVDHNSIAMRRSRR